MNSSSFDNSKSLSNRQGSKVLVKQKCNSSSTVQQTRILSSNVFGRKEKRGLSSSPGLKSTKYIYRNNPFQNGKSRHAKISHKPVVAWLRGQGIRLIIYLDDILIMASSVELVKQHKQITIRLLESLGFLINYDKSMLIPTQKIQFLGLLIDSTQMLFILPETKTTSIRKACQQLVNEQ